MTAITVEVISDIVCVWCYIGKRTLDKAITLYRKTYPGGKDDTFTIIWRPYYLNSDESGQSVDRSILRSVKQDDWSADKIAAANNRLDQAGQSVGIAFKHSGKIGHTRDAHRLIHLCQEMVKPTGTQDALVEKLFEAFHELEQDVADKSVLKRVALDSGLSEHEVEECLESRLGVEVVDEQAKHNREVVTNGVPTFLIQGACRIDGAQDVQEFMEAFVKVKDAVE